MKGLACSVRYRPFHPAHPFNPQSIHPHNRPTLPPPLICNPPLFPNTDPALTIPPPPLSSNLHRSPPPSSHHLFLLHFSLLVSPPRLFTSLSPSPPQLPPPKLLSLSSARLAALVS